MAQAAQKFKVGDMVIGNHPTRYGVTREGWIGRVTRVASNGLFFAKGEEGVEFDDLEPRYFNLYADSKKIVITHDGKTTTATLYKNDKLVESEVAKCSPEDTFDFNVGAKLALERLDRKVKYGEYTIVKVKYPYNPNEYAFKTKNKTATVGMTIEVPSPFGEPKVTVTEVIPGEKYTGAYPIDDMKEIKIVEVSKGWNGKVVCIKTPYDWWTVGKIYEVKDGFITADDGEVYPNVRNERYVDAKDVRHAGSNNCTKHNYRNEFIPIVEV